MRIASLSSTFLGWEGGKRWSSGLGLALDPLLFHLPGSRASVLLVDVALTGTGKRHRLTSTLGHPAHQGPVQCLLEVGFGVQSLFRSLPWYFLSQKSGKAPQSKGLALLPEQLSLRHPFSISPGHNSNRDFHQHFRYWLRNLGACCVILWVLIELVLVPECSEHQ